MAQSGEKFEFSCTGEEYKKIWEHYFDMKIDYGRIIDAIDDNDTFLKEASEFEILESTEFIPPHINGFTEINSGRLLKIRKNRTEPYFS